MSDVKVYKKVGMDSLTMQQFGQIVEIEESSGLEPYSREVLADCIEHLDTFACFVGDVVVGYITAQSHSRYFGGSLYIVNLNVSEGFRGQGIAKRLLYTVCEHYIRDRGDKVVSLDVAKTNTAMELYRKIGFEIADIPSRNGDSDVVMVMPLKALAERLGHGDVD